ncbi:MAG: hypothetical protein ACLUQ6_02410 [Alistipes onderdonkii]
MVRCREPGHAENFDTDSFTVDEGRTGHFFSRSRRRATSQGTPSMS